MLNNKSILITGGTGSFGRAFVEYILSNYEKCKKISVLSRDELKQYAMAQVFSLEKYPNIRYFLGDIRDRERLVRALEGVDIVVHAAALKQVPAAEYNPFEFIKTNILGAQNLIEACLDTSVSKVVALSTDKAAAPLNLYGATKLCSDKLFIAANNIRGGRDTTFSVVRYGNVMGSRGSVIPFFLKQRSSGFLPITHPDMTRFNISLDDAVKMVVWVINNAIGGEIFVPKIPSYRIIDLAKAICSDCELRVVGLRPGEKIHEEMITKSDSPSSVDLDNYFAILPPADHSTISYYVDKVGANLVDKNFQYSSDTNEEFLTVKQIRNLIMSNLDEKI